jgi:hypothetical protein
LLGARAAVLAAALAVGGALTGPMAGAGAAVPGGPAGTGAAVADSGGSASPGATVVRAGISGARADSARVPRRRGRFDAPRWVMLRSVAVPGWGQLHNRSWLKAVVLGGGEAALIAGLVQDDRRLRDLRAVADRAGAAGDEAVLDAAVAAYNDRLERFVARQWLLGGVVLYAMVDAYVDAQFRDFKVEFEVDPALPGGQPPGRARLALRWAF